MFALVLLLHSLLRWIVVGLGVVAVYRGVTGNNGGKPWRPADDYIGLGFTAGLDLQLAIGVVLFLYSPITILGYHELDLTAKSPVLLFWTFVHPLLMVAAVVLAHVGRVRIRRQVESGGRHRAATVFFGLALLLVVAGTPWPFLPWGRPLVWLRS